MKQNYKRFFSYCYVQNRFSWILKACTAREWIGVHEKHTGVGRKYGGSMTKITHWNT